MPISQLSTLFNTNPYYDDYTEDSGFLKALFKPGVAIQARELSQLQSYLQVQIERLGNNIFENGTIISDGGVADFRSNYVRINETLTSTQRTNLIGTRIASGDVIGRVIETIPSVSLPDDNYDIVVYTSETAGAFASTDSIATTGDNNPGIQFTVADQAAATPTVAGTDAISVTVNSGIYYVNGYFVKAASQTVTPYADHTGVRVFQTPTAAVGFRVSNEIVTEESDTSLRDPASGFYNHNAPGADRFKINLDLSYIGFTADIGSASGLSFDFAGDKPFVELLRLVNGAATKRVKYTDYNEIEETLARRTFDESGNYTVTTPLASAYEHGNFFSPSDDTKFAVAVSPHKSYIAGHELDLISPTYLEIDKARTKGTISNETLDSGLGNYFLVEIGAPGYTFGDDTVDDTENNPITDDPSPPIWDDPGVIAGGVNWPILDWKDSGDGAASPDLTSSGWGLETGQLWAGFDDGGIPLFTFHIKTLGGIVNLPVINFDTTSNQEALDEQWSGNKDYLKLYYFNLKSIHDFDGEQKRAVSLHPVEWSSTGGSVIIRDNGIPTQPLRLIPRCIIDTESSVGSGGKDGDGSLLFPVRNDRQITEDGIVAAGDVTINSAIVRRVLLTHTVTAQEAETNTFTIDSELPFTTTEDSEFVVMMGNNPDGSHPSNPTNDLGSVAVILEPDRYNISSGNNQNQIVLTTMPPYDTGDDDANYAYIWDNYNGTVGQNIVVLAPIFDDSSSRPSSERIFRTLSKQSNTMNSVLEGINPSDYVGGLDTDDYLTFWLNHAHIIGLTSVSDVNGGTTVPLSDIILDDGQRDDAFEMGKIKIPRSSLVGTGASDSLSFEVSIGYSYYAHSGGGPVVVDSYLETGAETDYPDIPVYIDPSSGKRRRLSKYIDFRPVAQTLGPPSREYDHTYIFFGLPHNGIIRSSISYKYYMPRIDTICVCDDRTFRIVKGIPADSPQAPPAVGKDMQLFKVRVEPYTFNVVDEVRLEYVNNQRSTMADLNDLEKKESLTYVSDRQEDLIGEGLASVSGMIGGHTAGASLIPDGIFIDDFTGHAFGDCSQKSYNISMDSVNGGLKPSFETGFIPVSYNLSDGLVKSRDGIITHGFNSNSILQQDDTSRYINPNPYGVKSFVGYMKLSPFGDFKYSLTKNPSVQVNTVGENNSRFIEGSGFSKYTYSTSTDTFFVGKKSGMNTVADESIINWVGRSKDYSYVDSPDPFRRDYARLPKPEFTSYPNRVKRSAQGRIVDESVVPYMVSTGITFTAENLKPGTDNNQSRVYAFLDGIAIGNSDGYLVGSTGHISGHIGISGDYFLTGTKDFRLTDDQNNNLNFATTSADAQFYAQGLINQNDDTYSGYRPVAVRRRSVRDGGSLSDILQDRRDASLETVKDYIDPLCQNFTIDAGASGGYDNGMFLDSVELRFAQIPDGNENSGGLPITVCIRPTVNGKSHPNKIVPLSTVTVRPGTTSETLGGGQTLVDSNVVFKFSSPVFLPPGQYSLCVETNSDQYKLHAAKHGDYLLNVDGSVSQNQLSSWGADSGGIRLNSLYLPMNNGSRSEEKQTKLNIRFNRCLFASSSYNENERTITVNHNISNMYAPHLPTTSTNIKYNTITFVANDPVSSLSIAKPTSLILGDENLEFNRVRSDFAGNNSASQQTQNLFTKTISILFPSASANSTITPVIDSERTGLIVQKYGITPNPNTFGTTIVDDLGVLDSYSPGDINYHEAHGFETRPTTSGINILSKPASSRYISKIVDVNNKANGIVAAVDAMCGNHNSHYAVFFRTNQNGPIDDQNYHLMVLGRFEGNTDAGGLPNPFDNGLPTNLTKENYVPRSGSVTGEFDKYQVKIVFTGRYHPDTVIKNLKVVPFTTK